MENSVRWGVVGLATQGADVGGYAPLLLQDLSRGEPVMVELRQQLGLAGGQRAESALQGHKLYVRVGRFL